MTVFSASLVTTSGVTSALLTAGSGVAGIDLLFDGVSLERDRTSLLHQDQKLECLGRGEEGAVFIHPADPSVVLKLISPSLNAILAGFSASKLFAENVASAQELSDLGIGSQHYGSRIIQGAYILANERVMGTTVEKLIFERRFGPAEYALIGALLARMAEHDIRVESMNLCNIMIGTTKRTPDQNRAYIIDGGKVSRFDPNLTVEQKISALWEQPVAIRIQSYLRESTVVTRVTRSFHYLIEDGLHPPQNWWEAVVRFVEDFYLGGR